MSSNNKIRTLRGSKGVCECYDDESTMILMDCEEYDDAEYELIFDIQVLKQALIDNEDNDDYEEDTIMIRGYEEMLNDDKQEFDVMFSYEELERICEEVDEMPRIKKDDDED